MSEYYVLQIKTNVNYNGYIHPFETKKNALKYLKENIIKRCNIDKELNFIGRKNAPSPEYRKSVYEYLQAMFSNDTYSHKMINYCDYKGEKRFCTVEDIVGNDENTYEDTNYYIHSRGFYDNEKFEIPSEYENSLGFVFAANNKGMRLTIDDLGTTIFFYESNGAVEFRLHGDIQIDARIEKTGEDNIKCIGETYYTPMLLSFFKDGICAPITLDEDEFSEKYYQKDPESCLKFKFEHTILSKLNESFIMVKKLTLSESAINDHIKSIKKIGYTVQKAPNGNYYMPPFINKSDATIIIESIQAAKISDTEKEILIKKFKFEFGVTRKSIGDFDEGEFPAPKRCEWDKREYGIIIFNMLRLLERPVLQSSNSKNCKKENLHDLIKAHYGVDICRSTIDRNLKDMINIGLPIKKVNNGVMFDMTDALGKAEFDSILKCIATYNISENEKNRLIQKLNNKFPIGKY